MFFIIYIIKLPKSALIINILIVLIKGFIFTLYFFFIFGIPYHAPDSIVKHYNLLNNKDLSTGIIVTILFFFTFGIYDFFDQVEFNVLKFYVKKNFHTLNDHENYYSGHLKIENFKISPVILEKLNKYFLNNQEEYPINSFHINVIKFSLLVIWILFGTILSILLAFNFNLIIKDQNEYFILFFCVMIFSFLYFGDIIPHGKKL